MRVPLFDVAVSGSVKVLVFGVVLASKMLIPCKLAGGGMIPSPAGKGGVAQDNTFFFFFFFFGGGGGGGSPWLLEGWQETCRFI